MVPLLKKPTLDKELMSNYSPVSNLSFVSKVLERKVAKRLHAHLLEKVLHETMQSAYRAHHSTEKALLKTHNDLLTALDDNCAAYLVLLDLSSAFDTINYETLFKCLHSQFGIKDTALTWTISYLSDRYQSFTANPTVTAESKTTMGVPQGSVLGPIRFTLYTSGIRRITDKHKTPILLYSNDSQL